MFAVLLRQYVNSCLPAMDGAAVQATSVNDFGN